MIRSYIDGPRLISVQSELSSRFGLGRGLDIGPALFSVPYQLRDELIKWLWERFDLPDPALVLREKQPFLSLSQLHSLRDQGVEFALHSHSHADTSRLGYEELKAEIMDNIGAFDEYNLPWQPWLAFPYGRECSLQAMIRLRQELGIQSFFGIRCRWQDNRPGDLLWQRSGIEAEGFNIWRDLYAKPVYRSLTPLRKPKLEQF